LLHEGVDLVISIRDVKKYYEGGLVKALDGISFEVEKGEIMAIMGPSGCGKSTLLNLIGALDVPTEGEICFAGKNIRQYVPVHAFRAKSIGFVFQFHHLIPNLSLLENVELPMFSLPVARSVRRRKAAELLKEMGLEERTHFLPTRVSGGERQRAAIARAMMNDPQLLLADEPTGSVDTVAGNAILDFLVALCRQKKMSMVIATHNHEVAARTDRILRIRNGRIENTPSRV
jgi:putative ABC transport system ATP-binding protein